MTGKIKDVFTNPDILYWKMMLLGRSVEQKYQRLLQHTKLRCQQCGRCCNWFEIPELDKKAFKRCPHYTDEGLCGIHDSEERPDRCRDFLEKEEFENLLTLLTRMHSKAFVCGVTRKFWIKCLRIALAIETGR